MNSKIIPMLALGAAALVSAVSCAKTISADRYVKTMSDLGCHLVTENDPKAQEVFQANGVTQKDIQTFRQKTEMPRMIEIAKEIAGRVAACHGAANP